MATYVLRRLLILPVILLLITIILFGALLLLPIEQRVNVYIPSSNPHLTAEEYRHLQESMIERYGLDDPFAVQYLRWLRNLVRGEWGHSPTWRQGVLQGLRLRAPATVELAVFSLVPSVLLALASGSWAARFQRRLPDAGVRIMAFLGWSFPSFILGLMLMNVLYAWLDWFPPGRASIWAERLISADGFRVTGFYTIDALLAGNVELVEDALRHLVLPGLTLAAMQWALLTRITRTSLLGVMREDYIVTAHAKGLPARRVVREHARPNALLPVVSAAGVVVTTFFSNVVVVEVLFGFNGIGYWAGRAILQADVPVALGFALFTGIVTVLTSLVADILYGLLDPRVRLH